MASIRYLSCYTIGKKINKELKKNSSEDPPFIKLSGSTLTAMVYDGVLERQYNDFEKCYMYRPVLPINEDNMMVASATGTAVKLEKQ